MSSPWALDSRGKLPLAGKSYCGGAVTACPGADVAAPTPRPTPQHPPGANTVYEPSSGQGSARARAQNSPQIAPLRLHEELPEEVAVLGRRPCCQLDAPLRHNLGDDFADLRKKDLQHRRTANRTHSMLTHDRAGMDFLSTCSSLSVENA